MLPVAEPVDSVFDSASEIDTADIAAAEPVPAAVADDAELCAYVASGNSATGSIRRIFIFALVLRSGL